MAKNKIVSANPRLRIGCGLALVWKCAAKRRMGIRICSILLVIQHVKEKISDSRVTMPNIVAGFLIITAALKVALASQISAIQAAHHISHWLVIAAVQAELVVAFLLLSGWRPRLAWRTTIGLFLVFAAFSLYRAVAGYESCGCFGPLKVNPWWTFVLDAGIVSLLIAKRRGFSKPPQVATSAPRLFAVTSGYVLLAGLLLSLMVGAAPVSVGAGVSVLDHGKLVILTPTEWIDEAFPLNDQISPSIGFSKNECIMLLYHHDCPKCQEALPRYDQLAREIGKHTQIWLVEVPPFGESLDDAGAAQHARLSADREWFVQTPVEIQLRDGNVTLASQDLPSVAGFP